MAIKPIQILINAKDNASSVFSSLQTKVAAVGVAIAGYFGIKLFASAVESAEKLDTQMRKLDAVITATGGAAGLTAQEIDEMARRLDEATLGSAEGFRDAATQLLTFKSVGKDAFETTLMLAQDLAEAGFGTVTTNAVQLGKALEDPVKGLTALTRSGVTFTEEQQNVIRVLKETGRTAEAQRLILEAVAGQVGGTAKAIGGGLSGAVDLVNKRFTDLKEQLGAAVLPVFQRFNELVAETYKRLTDDGTVGRFGEAIAKGFQAALDWARAFLAEVDFKALADQAASAADQIGETFTRVGEWATNAGDSVKLAYGVMSGGVNTVKAAILGLGSVFAEIASKIMSGVATLREGLAKISFGGLSAGFKEAAEDARISSGAFGESAQALRDAAEKALLDVEKSATMARTAWAGLTAEVEKTPKAAAGSAESLAAIADQIERVGREAAAARKATQDKRDADEAAAKALAALRQEYAQLIAKGDLEAAALKLEQINKALRDTPKAAGDATKAAVEVAMAFKAVGIQTKEELEKAAVDAKKNFDLIKASGKATADGLQTAFQKYAEAAIAANGGVATDALKAQAAMQGLEIASDSTGKAVVRAMGSGAEAAKVLTSGIQQATEAVKEHIGWLDRLEKRNAEVKSTLKMDADGFAADDKGNRVAMGGDLNTLTGIAAFLKAAGVDDDEAARRIAKEFADANGNVQYFNNPGQKKYGGEFSTISDALLKAAETYTFGGAGVGGAAGTSGSSKIPKQTREVNLNLSVNGVSYGRVATDDAGADVLQRLLDDLGRGKRSAS
jgi:hypothetical protein